MAVQSVFIDLLDVIICLPSEETSRFSSVGLVLWRFAVEVLFGLIYECILVLHF